MKAFGEVTISTTCSRMFSRICGRTRRLRQTIGRIHSSAGFSLTELIVIIVMAGVLAATVAMKFGSLTSGTNLRTAIDQVAGDLRFLQSRSMATFASRAATFPGGGRTYNIDGDVKSLPSGVTISSPLTVTFNSLGEYATTTHATLIFNSGGGTSSIRIYAISGDVEAY